MKTWIFALVLLGFTFAQAGTDIVPLKHVRASSVLPYEAYIKRFELKLGKNDPGAYQSLLSDPKNAKKVEEILNSQTGSSGFMIFAVYDHGALLALEGKPRKASQYVIGNPLIALRMTEHDVRAGLYAPLRVFIYQDEQMITQIEYDLPSSLFGQLKNAEVDRVAEELDGKIAALISLK